MLRFEEYVARRKKEDHVNEFDIEARAENVRIFVNYVFEYFNSYLSVTEAEDRTVLENEKLDKFRRQVERYDPDVRDWLVSVYSQYGHVMPRTVSFMLKKNEFFFLANTDQEFRSMSYECYSQMIRKYPFLRDQTETLFLLVKNYHRLLSQERWPQELPLWSDDINSWVEETWAKYQVNLVAFAQSWVMYFWDHKDIWPVTHRMKSQEEWLKWEYDFRKKTNLFNLDSLYGKMPKKSFTRGRKQEFEVLMMYFWLHEVVGDEIDYWTEYLQKVLTAL